MIRAESATLTYFDQGKEIFACRDAHMEVHPGEFVGILGPSGSGKSSLLYLLSGLKLPTQGSVAFEGNPYSALSDRERAALRLEQFGFVFQFPNLLGYLTALENVLIARPDRDLKEHAAMLLAELGIGAKSHRFPHELSGGERQRVCVARALLGEPAVIFADEPTASLDHTNGVQVVDLLRRHRKGGALVMVTHDVSMLEQADRVVRIEDSRIVS